MAFLVVAAAVAVVVRRYVRRYVRLAPALAGELQRSTTSRPMDQAVVPAAELRWPEHGLQMSGRTEPLQRPSRG